MKSWYKMKLIPHKNKSSDAEVDLLDEIGAYGVTAAAFKKDFDSIKNAKNIRLNISSPGGSVFDGVTIYNILSDVKDKLTVDITGLAASISSIIALAGSKVTMREGSLFMIHNPWTGIFGDADELRKEADTLDKIKDQLVSIYVNNSNLDADAVEGLMNAETWMNPEEAKAMGFITDIDEAQKIAASYNKPLDGYGFLNTPKSEVDADFEQVELQPQTLPTNISISGKDLVYAAIEYKERDEVEELEEMAKRLQDKINKFKINRIKNEITKIEKTRK